MKRKITACLLAGVLILAVSAGAAFDSINGYATYKNGVKKLLLETNNVTLRGGYSAVVDGKELIRTELDKAADGSNSYFHSKERGLDGNYEYWTTNCDGQHISYNSEMKAEKTYNGWKTEAPARQQNLLGISADDELNKRAITFLELAADTIMGDLKNNFVSLGKEDGVSRYQVDISKAQVPEVINAGLSLLAYSEGQREYSVRGVHYEDYEASFAVYYEEQTGQAIPQELMDNYWNGTDEEWIEANMELVEAFSALQAQYRDEGNAALEALDGGYLLIHADNSRTHYTNPEDYYEATNQVTLDRYVGEDASLESVLCTFGVDEKGYLVENDITATFASVDRNGNRHTLSATAGFTAGDYGATAVRLPDLTGWTNIYNRTTESSEVIDSETIAD